MKKTLIALSLAALSSAAMADVTLYGTIKAGVETGQTKVKTTTTTEKSHTETAIADFGSRIGFKGHEHLGSNRSENCFCTLRFSGIRRLQRKRSVFSS